MKYYEAIDTLEARGITLTKTLQILSVLSHYASNCFAQCIALTQHADMEPTEAMAFLRRHEYI